MNTTQRDVECINNTRRAMLKRYLINPTDNEWEHLKEAMYLEMQQYGFHGGFPIAAVAREDLESQGFDTAKVTDDQMADIAGKMQDAYCDNDFWVEIETIADDLNILRKDDESE